MSILKDKISKNKKKIMIATGAAVVAVAITIGEHLHVTLSKIQKQIRATQ